jgi:exodeoxyribonuclease VII small subunit
MEAKTFREAYAVLQDHAQTLREQTEPNIDDLLSIVTESVAAYKVCKERIDAVEKALQEALTNVGTDAGGRSAEDDWEETPAAKPATRRTPERPSARFDEDIPPPSDDDLPF